MNINSLSNIELLQTYSQILDVLTERDIVRTRNAPLGGYAEWLVCESLGYERAITNTKGYDATDKEGATYQIKSRIVGKSLGVTRSEADYLIAVIFNEDYTVRKAVKVPWSIVEERSTLATNVNGSTLRVADSLCKLPAVDDITELIINAK